MTAQRYYLDDLFPKGEIAQVPYFYPKSHNELLNKLVQFAKRGVDSAGRVYYELEQER